jgi:hypothetical protein
VEIWHNKVLRYLKPQATSSLDAVHYNFDVLLENKASHFYIYVGGKSSEMSFLRTVASVALSDQSNNKDVSYNILKMLRS